MKYFWQVTASGWERIGARLVDSIVELIVLILIFCWISDKTTIERFSPFVTLVIITLEFIFPVLTKGKTIGKTILGLRMISDSGGYASGGQLFARSLMYTAIPFLDIIIAISLFSGLNVIISLILFLGDVIILTMLIIIIMSFGFIFSDDYHQALHDKFGSICVVKDKKYKLYLRRLTEQK